MMARGLIAGLLLGGLLGGSYSAYRIHENGKADAAMSTHLTAYGNVDIRRVALAFRATGRLTELHFEEGDCVTSGALVASLDRKPFEEGVVLQEAAVAAAKAELQRLENGYRPQEIKMGRAVVAQREASLRALQLEYERLKSLVSDGAISRQSYDDITARRDETRAQLESAREELALREEGFRQEDIARARALLASAQAQLEIARTNRSDADLYAPQGGIVLTRVLEPGSIVHLGDTVLTLSLTDPVWVRAYIPEPDLGKIHPGMKAEVLTDSRPDRAYVGHIGYISPEAEFTPKNVETPDLRTRLVYGFRIIVDNPDAGLRQGMPVTVRLLATGTTSTATSVAAEAHQ